VPSPSAEYREASGVLHWLKDKKTTQLVDKRRSEVDALATAGYHIEQGGLGQVLIRMAGEKWFQFWPSTGKWINRQAHESGTLPDSVPLETLIRQQVGRIRRH
jgi:hypothetical protein